MYARLVRFTLDPGQRAAAQKVADDLAPDIAAQQGCEGVTVFGDDADGQWGIFVLWDTQVNADAASRIIRPILDQHLSGLLKAPLDARLYDVISK